MGKTDSNLFVRRNSIANPSVLFLHGFPENSRKWQPYLDLFATHGIGAIALDLPGFGQSGFIDGENYNPIHVADLLIKAWDKESTNPMYLVGHDWGGIIGWYMASKLGRSMRGFTAIAAPHPLRFAHLLSSNEQQRHASKYIEIFCSETGIDFCRKRNFERMMIGLCTEQNKVNSDELDELVQNWSESARLNAMLMYYKIFFTATDYWANLLGPISTDVQIVWGTQDHALVPANIDGLAGYLPNLTFKIFSDAAHWLDRSHFGQVSHQILEHFECKTCATK